MKDAIHSELHYCSELESIARRGPDAGINALIRGLAVVIARNAGDLEAETSPADGFALVAHCRGLAGDLS